MWRYGIVAISIATACGSGQHPAADDPVARVHAMEAACGANQRYDTTTADGEREHERVAACMRQMQTAAMHERDREAQEREQPTASNACGEDATLSERTTDDGNRRHIAYIECLAQQHMQRERDQETAQWMEQQRQSDLRQEREQQQRLAEREQRRKARETAPCTEDNTRQGLKDEIAEHEAAGQSYDTVVQGRFEDEVQRRQKQCVDTRFAPCQAKIDVDNDLLGAAECWKQVHDRVDEPGVNQPEDIQACLDGVTQDLQAVQTCVALPERSDDEVIVKADCMTQTVRDATDPSANLPRSRSQRKRPDNTCGHFSLGKYVAQQLAAAKIDDEAARIEAKAKDPRARVGVRNSACNSFNVITLMEGQLAQERAVGRESGYVDANKMHEIGSTLVLLRTQQHATLDEFRRIWKRSLDRTRDCKGSP